MSTAGAGRRRCAGRADGRARRRPAPRRHALSRAWCRRRCACVDAGGRAGRRGHARRRRRTACGTGRRQRLRRAAAMTTATVPQRSAAAVRGAGRHRAGGRLGAGRKRAVDRHPALPQGHRLSDQAASGAGRASPAALAIVTGVALGIWLSRPCDGALCGSDDPGGQHGDLDPDARQARADDDACSASARCPRSSGCGSRRCCRSCATPTPACARCRRTWSTRRTAWA